MYTVKYTSRTKLKARACAHHGANKPEHVSRAPCWAKKCSKTHTTNCVGRTASAIFAPFYDSRKKTRKKAEAAARQPTGRSSSPPNSPVHLQWLLSTPSASRSSRSCTPPAPWASCAPRTTRPSPSTTARIGSRCPTRLPARRLLRHHLAKRHARVPLRARARSHAYASHGRRR